MTFRAFCKQGEKRAQVEIIAVAELHSRVYCVIQKLTKHNVVRQAVIEDVDANNRRVAEVNNVFFLVVGQLEIH